MTTPPGALPPLPGGATDDPRSSALPVPLPLLPRPLPVSDFPPPPLPPIVGGGGTTAFPSSPVPPRFLALPDPPVPFPPKFAGGGTTSVASCPLPDRPRLCSCASDPLAEGGGGTGCERKSPLRVLPQLSMSWTCDGGGAITVVGGSESLAVEDARSRVGAETGGATTSVVCESCVRELARSRGVLGAGATTVDAIAFEARSFSAAMFGAGAITVDVIAELRRVSCTTSGAGAITPDARLA